MAGASAVRVRRANNTKTQFDARPATVVGVCGVTERGPIGERVQVSSWEHYKQIYGDLNVNSDVSMWAFLAYQEAGADANLLLEVSRAVHLTDPADPATATSDIGTLTLNTAAAAATAGSVLASNVGPYDLEPGDTLIISVNGGANATATFNATAASRTGAATAPYALANNQTLTVSIDGGSVQTVAFLTSEFVDISNATAAEVAAVLAAKLVGVQVDLDGGAPRIRSDRRGTSSGVNVTGGTANAELGFTTGNVAGTGNVANIEAVTVAEVETIVEAAVAGSAVTNVAGAAQIATTTAGAGGSIQVVASSTADDEFGFDNAVHAGSAGGAEPTLRVDGKTDGAYANALSVLRSAPTSGRSGEFDFAVLRNGVIVESWKDVSMDDAADNYVVSVVNNGFGTQVASNLIALVDLNSTLASPDNLPAAGTFGPLTGGNDGLVGLVDADFVGGVTSGRSAGLRVLDSAERLHVLVVPGRATATVHNAMVTYAEVTREGLCFAVLDPPASNTTAQIRTYVTSTASLKGLTELAAIYWPRILVGNPNTAVYGNDALLTVAPSGPVVGMMARVDASKVGGAFEHPAGQDVGRLRTVRGIEGEADGVERAEVRDKAKRGLVFDDLINPIMSKRGRGVYVDGARALKDSSDFPTVGESRGVVFVSIELLDGLDPKRHRNINERLINSIKMDIDQFLRLLTDKGCFSSTTYEEAFFVDTSPALNTAAAAEQRQVQARVGLATSKPAEFINVEIGQLGLQAQFDAVA